MSVVDRRRQSTSPNNSRDGNCLQDHALSRAWGSRWADVWQILMLFSRYFWCIVPRSTTRRGLVVGRGSPVDGYRRREGQGTVVAWRITPRPEHRDAVLVSIQEIRRKAILGASKDFRLIVGFEAICLKPRKIDNGRRTTKVEYAL